MRALPCLATAAAVLALLPAPAPAAEESPPEPGCRGLNAEDPAGDVRAGFRSMDLTAAYLTTFERQPAIAIRLVELDAGLPERTDVAKSYFVHYRGDDGRKWTLISTVNFTGGPPSFTAQRGSEPSRGVRGRWFPGPGGVVVWRLPEPASQITIDRVSAEAFKAGGVEYEPDENELRRTYDSAMGRTQALACPAPSAPAPAEVPAQGDAPAPPAAGVVTAGGGRTTVRRRRVTVRVRGRRLTGTVSVDGAPPRASLVRLVGGRERVVRRSVIREGRFAFRLGPRARGRYAVRVGTTRSRVVCVRCGG